MMGPQPGRLHSQKVASRWPAILLQLAISSVTTVAAIPAAHAQTFQVIYNFGTYGAHPNTGLTIDHSGSLYGTTPGSVFKLSNKGSGWIFSPLYFFHGKLDGTYPYARPVFGPGGLLYGSTTEGGGLGCEGYGCGTVYSLRPGPHSSPNIFAYWKENILYRFAGGTDGADPQGDLVFDQTGTLYGTDNVGTTGWGAVYSLTPSNGTWKQTVLYNFTGGLDGGGLFGGVIFDNAGRLYGAAFLGGTYNDGTIFRLTPSNGAWTFETLYDFQGLDDGLNPAAGLTFDASGNLYGTSLYGGSGSGGTAFMLSPSNGNWTLTVLYSFAGPAGSFGTLTLDAAGNVYGTTVSDGVYQQGSVFKLTPSNGGWTYTSLHDFTGGNDGARPWGGVVLDAAGDVYGTTQYGGQLYGQGVVYEIMP